MTLCAAAAKDIIKQMLERDARKRITAAALLQHEWLRENGVAPNAALELEVLNRIRKFCAGNRLRKEAIRVIASNMPIEEISGMK